MELWIRSQSKIDLMCVKRVQYGHANNKHIIYGENLTMFLGEYATRERCLEIIDEIQKILSHNGIMLFKNIDISEIPKEAFEPFKTLSYLPYNDKNSEVTVHNAEVIVYEMPEK